MSKVLLACFLSGSLFLVALRYGKELYAAWQDVVWYDPYEVLDVDRGASGKEIGRRYRELTRTHHPDKGGDEELFRLISEAHGMLSILALTTPYYMTLHRSHSSSLFETGRQHQSQVPPTDDPVEMLQYGATLITMYALGLIPLAAIALCLGETKQRFLMTLRSLFILALYGASKLEADGGVYGPYKILGLDKWASAVEIRQRYRELTRTHHPDKGGDEEIFREISEAYTILKESDWVWSEPATPADSAQRKGLVEWYTSILYVVTYLSMLLTLPCFVFCISIIGSD